MFTAMRMRDVAGGFARGAVPTVVFFCCLGLAYAFDAAAFLLSFGGLIVYGVLTASGVLWAGRPFDACVAAVLPAGLVTAGIVVDSWVVIPLFAWLLLAASGVHVALRLLEGRGTLVTFAASALAFTAAATFAWLTFGAGSLVIGSFALANLAAILALRLRIGPPVEPRP